MVHKKQASCKKANIAGVSFATFSRYSKKVLTSLLAQLVVLPPCAWAYNDIVPPQNVQDKPINHIVIDPDRAGDAFLDRAQNGTPVININAPSKGGVSVNYYREFNINSENLIWNNFQGEAGISKLGGALHGNPNFNKPGTRPAEIILNEVTGTHISNIGGYGEVFGTKVENIIANPNGIMVGGAGFINTSRLSLITGSSNGLDANGKITSFNLSPSLNAIITVISRDVVDADGNPVAYNLGIDMSGGNIMDLISRIVKINGKLLAGQEINILTGNDKATRTPDGWTVTSKNADDKPEFAIDSTALGGIYAGRIHLIANEDGIGVRTRGDVISSMDDVRFDAHGNIVIDNTVQATKNVGINATGSVQAASNIVSQNADINISGQGVDISSNVSAKKNIAINSGKGITSTGAIFAENGDLKLEATDEISASGKLAAGHDIVLTGNKNIALNNVETISGNDLTLTAKDAINASGKLTAQRNAQFKANNTIVIDGQVNAGADLNAQSDTTITISNGAVQAGNNITLDTFTALLAANLSANNDIILQIPNLTVDGGDITAGNDISIKSDKIANRNVVKANNALNITTNTLDNTGGKLVAIGDFVLDLSNRDWSTSGTLQAGGTLSLMAKDLTNINGDISAGDLVINAANFTNGSDTVATIMGATNTLALNITGDLMNYGTLRGGTDVSINAINVVNGAATGSSATIHAGRDMVIQAAQRIINRGFLQALGNLTLTTTSAINDDYVLNPNAQKLATDNDTTLAPEYQAIYDALDTTTDTAQLYDLLANVKTSEQFYKVQKRLQMLRIDEVLTEYGEMSDGADIDNLVSLPEDEMQESLAELLGDDYDAADWTIDLSGDIANINSQISDQQQRADDYNAAERVNALAQYEEDKETARQEYADLNGGDDTGFEYPDFEYTPVSREDYATLSGEDYLDYDTMVAAAETAAKTARANKIATFIGDTTTIVNEYRTYDWSSMTDSDIADKMAALMGDEYNPSDWIIPPFKKADALQLSYINSLRINSVNRGLVEKTGIHNDGRIYSGADMGLNSNSVLHNNRGALIYSTGDMALSVENYLFNNANAAGQGILSKGALSITSQNNGWLDHLINYDGTIESDLDLNLHATEVVNYGSDSIDLSGIDNNIYPAMEYRYHWTETKRVLGRKKKKHKSRVISEAEYNQMKAAGQNVTATYLGYNYVKDYPELQASYYTTKKHLADQRHNATVKTDKDEAHLTLVSETSKIRSNRGTLSILTDDLVNYNSQIFGENVDITAQNVLNQNLTLNLNIKEYYVQRYRKCKRVAGVCVDHYQARKEWTHNIVEEYQGLSPSTIVAAKNLKINVQTLGNGTKNIDPTASGSTTLPYDPTSMPETELQEIVRTGTIDPLSGFKLPDGGYGIIHQSEIPNSHYLYETDPTLIDLEHYLGSKYLMNRIGMDPDDVDAKFLGDAYVEHQMIKDALDKTQGFRNKVMTDAETEEYINSMYDTVTQELVADLGLEFGRALTPQQISKLDHDIVWYVKQNITLPNGETVEVLVPQVFLAQDTVDELYGAALARDDTKASIRGDNVSIDAISAEAESRLDNMGAIVGNRQLVITTDQINNSARTVGYQTPVLSGGDVLVLDTGEGGVVNNRGGRIETTNADSILAINTGELNNITLTQAESQDRGNYKRVETHIGDTATISGAGDTLIVTSGDLNMAGSKIGTVGDMAISVGGDLNTVSIQDYEYEYAKHSSGDAFSKKTKTDIKSSVKNIGSEISAGGDMGASVGGNATFAGTTVNVGGNADIDVAGDTNIVAVVDSDYEYHKTKKSSYGGLVKEKDITEDSAQHLQGANVNVVDGLTLNTGNNLNILASDVNVGGNADIDAGNNINIMAGDEVSTHYELHEKTNYLNGALNMLGTVALGSMTAGVGLWAGADSVDVGCENGHCGANMTIGKQTKDETYTETHTAIGSAIKVGGDLSMDAKNDINIVGSDISADGTGSVNAGNNINILEAQNTQKTTSSHEDTKISVSANVGNAYVDAGYAATDAVKAADAVVKATEDLHHMQELHKQGKASSEAVRDAELALAMATANAVNAELGLVSSTAGAASAASTSFGTGMYGSAGANFETTKSTNSSDTKQSVASNLFGENISFTSGNNMTQVGANVSATDTVSYDIGNDLNVLASTDTYRTKSDSQTITAGATIGNNAVQVNAGYSESSNRASGTTYNNSNITAENITVKTGNDATFAGANVTADDKLAMDIGGNLNIESKQDTDYAKGNNWGVNAGVGNTGSASGGFNVGSSNHDSAWVNDVTELRGGDVDINVGGKTTVTGAVIAAGEDGDLNLATNELEYKDLHDFNTSNERGFGVNTGIGISTDKGETNLHPQGSTTISATHTGSATEQTTHATIGAGNITVGGDPNPELAGLNRDTDKVQEITKDEITGSLDSSVTVDNRIFSESGREQIAKQHEDFVDNIEQIGDGLQNNIVTKSIENAITDDTKNIIDTVGDYIEQDRQVTEMMQKRQDLVNALNGLTNYDSAEAREVLQQVADFVAGTDGFKGDLKLANIDGDVIGFAYQNNDGSVKNISLNLANIDITDPNALMNALYHETTNFEQHTKNEQTAKNRGDTGSGIFDLKNYGNENTNSKSADEWLSANNDSSAINSGNMTFVKDVISGADGTGTTNYSTYGDLDIDGTKLVITNAKADGSTAIIDNATGKVIAESLFDDSFVMYDVYGRNRGAAKDSIIYLNKDVTPYIDAKVSKAAFEPLPVWGLQSRTGGDYDIKNVLNPSGSPYDGMMYNGKAVSVRGLGNLTFGRNTQNSWVDNDKIRGIAGFYHQKSNDIQLNEFKKYNNLQETLGETHEATKYILKGIEEERNKPLFNLELWK